MDYLLGRNNSFCRVIGHWYGPTYRDADTYHIEGVKMIIDTYKGPLRRTCQLCGYTNPPRKDND